MKFHSQAGVLSATAQAEVNTGSRNVDFRDVKSDDKTLSFVENLNFGGNQI